MTDFVFITDLHITTISRVRSGDYLKDLCKKLQYVVDYCNNNNAMLLMGGDIFDKATVPDYVKSEFAAVLSNCKIKPRAICGNHDRLWDNPEYNYRTSYYVEVSHGLFEDLKTEDLGDVILTSEVPVITRNKPQIVMFHGFLNQETTDND